MSTRFSTVEVTGPDGEHWQSGDAEGSGATVTQRLAELGPAGSSGPGLVPVAGAGLLEAGGAGVAVRRRARAA